MNNYKKGDCVITEWFNDTNEYTCIMAMDNYIGQEGTITELSHSGATVHGFGWPLSALTPVIENPTCKEVLQVQNITPAPPVDTVEQAAETTWPELDIPATRNIIGLNVAFTHNFTISQSNDFIKLDLTQALQLSDFILNLNSNQQIVTHLQTLLSSQQREIEELREQLRPLFEIKQQLAKYRNELQELENAKSIAYNTSTHQDWHRINDKKYNRLHSLIWALAWTLKEY